MSVILRSCKRVQNVPFLIGRKLLSNLPIPNLEVLNVKAIERDILQPFRQPLSSSDPSTLAGEPKAIPNSVPDFRPEILEKWSERPERDIYKQWAKLSITY